MKTTTHLLKVVQHLRNKDRNKAEDATLINKAVSAVAADARQETGDQTSGLHALAKLEGEAPTALNTLLKAADRLGIEVGVNMTDLVNEIEGLSLTSTDGEPRVDDATPPVEQPAATEAQPAQPTTTAPATTEPVVADPVSTDASTTQNPDGEVGENDDADPDQDAVTMAGENEEEWPDDMGMEWKNGKVPSYEVRDKKRLGQGAATVS